MVIIYCSLFSIVSLCFGTDFIYPFFFFLGKILFILLLFMFIFLYNNNHGGASNWTRQYNFNSFVFQIQTNGKPSARIFLLEILL